MLVHREQQSGYDIAVTVWPPEPKTGLLVFTVLIQAVAVYQRGRRGAPRAHLLRPDAPRSRPFGRDGWPFPAADRSARIQPLRRSHSRRPGRAVGPSPSMFQVLLADVTTNVPLEVLPSDSRGLLTWLLIGGWTLGILLSGGLLVLFFRRLRRTSDSQEE